MFSVAFTGGVCSHCHDAMGLDPQWWIRRCRARPVWGPIFFNCMQFSGNICPNNRLASPPLGLGPTLTPGKSWIRHWTPSIFRQSIYWQESVSKSLSFSVLFQNYLLNREHFLLLTTVCRCFLRLCWLFYIPRHLCTGNQCRKSLLNSWKTIFLHD